MNHARSIITATLVTVAAIASIAVTPTTTPPRVAVADAATSSPGTSTSPGTSAGKDAAYSADSLSKLQSLESSIASAGACSLSARSLTNLISSLAASPFVPGTALKTSSAKTCANVSAVANPNLTASAITSMWAWGNPVSPAVDARGLGESEFVPSTIASYSAARSLTNVRLSAPWASDQGAPIRTWLGDSVTDIHANGETVFALGGDTAWVANPDLVSQWITADRAAAAFDGVQLDVEPWTADPNWTSNSVAIASYLAMVQQAEATAHSLGMKLGIDAPWWLSTTPYLSGTVLTALLPYVDSVSIVAFSDHAGGTDGIIAQAWPAVTEANAALTPFTIGVQTSSDYVAGGSHYTFADTGSAALETESNRVRAAYTLSVGYAGVTVEEYLSWLSLRP